MSAIEEIKKAIAENKLVIGERATIRNLRKNNIKLVVISNNTPEIMTKELKSLCDIDKIDFQKVEKDNIELGITCRKPFGVSVLSIKK